MRAGGCVWRGQSNIRGRGPLAVNSRPVPARRGEVAMIVRSGITVLLRRLWEHFREVPGLASFIEKEGRRVLWPERR
jgi:hypothetical protein